MVRDNSTVDHKFRVLDARDLDAVGALHLLSWRGTYAHVLPAAYLGAPMARDISARWSGGLRARDLLCGAFSPEGRLLGFAAVRLDDEPGREGGSRKMPYLDNLHLMPEARGLGVADGLMGFLADQLIERREQGLWLTVLDSNARARGFYRRLGGVEEAAGPDEMFGHKVTSYPVRWADLRELSKNARQALSPLDGAREGP